MRHSRENEQRLEAQLDQEMSNAESKRGSMLAELRTEQRRVEAEERASGQLKQKLEEAKTAEFWRALRMTVAILLLMIFALWVDVRWFPELAASHFGPDGVERINALFAPLGLAERGEL